MMMSIIIPSRKEPRIVQMLEETEMWFPDSQIITANDRYGKGKGWAVREALQEADGDVIIFIDGDLEIHPRMILRLIPFLQDYDVVVGKKQVRGLLSRRILTLLSRIYIWMLFGLNFDTQTGIKAFNRHALSQWKANSFAFDIEILSKCKDQGLTIIEIPVDVTGSKPMNPKSIIKCFIESLKIWRRRINENKDNN